MSQWDDSQDAWDRPYTGDGAGPAAPPPADPNGPGSHLWNWVAQVYQSAVGRPPENDDVIRQWIQGTGGDYGKIQQGIYATPEAQAYGSRNAQTPAPPPPAADSGPAPAPVAGPAPVAASSGAPAPVTATTAAPGGAPTYTAPAPLVAPPAFSYHDFKGPTPDEILNDPDYQLTRDQGISAIGHKNAALGTLNTGGTIGDFIGFAGNLAHAKYGDIYNRDFNTYSANRANAFDTYKTNYGIGKDVYDTNVQDQYQNPFSNNLASAGLNQNNNQFNASLGTNTNQFNANLGFNTWLQNYKMSVTDPFSEKYQLLGLL